MSQKVLTSQLRAMEADGLEPSRCSHGTFDLAPNVTRARPRGRVD
ncbi:hypothetical protein [Enorma burkinafasonensis]|nr:hypothetical protein [Enorma burkinafasonensis]MCI7731433.1 hypothetical protein [Enorma burkinafasonensis]